LSSQKEKYLISAQKYIQKGQFDRALRDYEQIVTADPKDVKHRQKLAELMVRCNRPDDAVREYETIAKFYDENGFYLKAIAVYKQIQRLDPANMGVCLSLAALNEKQGMIGNALSEYKVIFDYYEREGNAAEAIKVLEKMQTVDPENVDIRLKLAETLHAAGSDGQAYSEFSGAAMALRNRGNADYADRVIKRIQVLYPERGDSSLNQLADQIAAGQYGETLPKVRHLLEHDPDNVRLLGLLGEACRLAGDVAGRREAMEKMVRLAPDDLVASKGLIEATLESGDPDAGLALVTGCQAALCAAGAHDDLERYLLALQAHVPYDVRLLDGLKTLYQATGDTVKLADVEASLAILSRPAAAAQDDSAVLSSVIDEAAFAAADVTTDADGFVWGDELDLTEQVVSADTAAAPREDGGSAEYDLVDLGLDAGVEETVAPDGFEIDISFELPDDAAVFSPGVPDAASELSASLQPATGAADLPDTASAPWSDELDLAAMADLEPVASAAPEYSLVDDFGAIDLSAVESAVGDVTDESCSVDVSFDFDETSDIFAPEPPQEEQVLTAMPAVEAEPPAALVEELTVTDGFSLDVAGDSRTLDIFTETPASSADLSLSSDDSLPLTDLFLDEEQPWEDAAISLTEEVPAPAAPPVVERTMPVGGDAAAGSDKYAFDGLFARFKEGLDQQVDSDDTETHYNLGIAYMEMGLHDDAIKEFLIAATDPQRTLDCLTLQGVCSREKGDFETAEHCFSAGLSLEGLEADRLLSFRYELALLYQVSGRREAALQAFREVFATNPGFRDTMQRISALSGGRDSFDFSELDEAAIELEPLD
jgi:pilus assembly protein FimV